MGKRVLGGVVVVVREGSKGSHQFITSTAPILPIFVEKREREHKVR